MKSVTPTATAKLKSKILHVFIFYSLEERLPSQLLPNFKSDHAGNDI